MPFIWIYANSSSVDNDVILETVVENCTCEDERYNIGLPGETTFISAVPNIDEEPIPSKFDVYNKPCIRIEGTLVIDVWTNFGGIADIIMGKGASIEVRAPNAQLYIGASHIHGCDYMWKGIEVFDESGVSLIHSTIEDATIAIRSREGSNFSGFRSTYLNNFIGHQVEGFVGPGPSIQSTGPVDNVYTSDRDLLPHYDGLLITEPWVGMKLVNAWLWVIGSWHYPGFPNRFEGIPGVHADRSVFRAHDNQFVDIVHQNGGAPIRSRAMDIRDCPIAMLTNLTFSNCNNEVLSYRSRLRVDNCDFLQDHTDVSLNTWSSSIGIFDGTSHYTTIQNCVFDNYQFAVQLRNSPSVPIFIFRNNMVQNNNSYSGITSRLANAYSYHRTAQVFDNTFLREPDGYIGGFFTGSGSNWIVRDNDSELGIEIYGLDNSIFENNTIDYSTIRSGSTLAGINSWNSFDNIYCCNSVNNAYFGFYARGMQSGTLLRGFDFNNCGLLSLFIHSNGFIGPQEFGGNEWLGAPSYDAMCQGNPLFSRFDVHPSLMPNSLLPANGWFFPGVGAPLNTCSLVQDCNVPELGGFDGGGINGLTLEDAFLQHTYGEQVQWTADLRLYKQVLDDPSLATDDRLGAFLLDMEGTDVVAIANLEDQIRKALDPGALGDQLDAQHVIIEDLMGDMVTLRTSLEAAPEEEADQLRNEIYTLGMGTKDVWQGYVDLQEQIAQNQEDRLLVAYTDMSNMQMTTLMGRTWQEVHLFFIQSLLGQTWTTDQLADLFDLGRGCIMTHGRSLIVARTLYEDYTNQVIDWDALEKCTSSDERRAHDVAEVRSVHVSPNPFNSECMVTWKNESYTMVEIWDITGQRVAQYDVDGRQSQVIDASNWVPGTYILVMEGGASKHSEVIIKQ